MAGKVYLVGAGPGDPGLITVRGAQVLARADVVVYDRLVPPSLLSLARPGAKLVDAREGHGTGARAQKEINALLIEEARAGKKVVRLKGGDPFVFGRGGEEALALVRAGVEFEVVPGVSSVVAVPAYAGIPVTHREFTSCFTVATGHEDPSKGESCLKWAALAATGGTIVVVMAVRRLEEVVGRLLEGGLSGETPAALIEWGTTPRQRVVEAPLASLAARAREEGLDHPALLVVGEVVRLRKELAWFERKPLSGLRVLVTRAEEQAGELSQALKEAGAEPLEVPCIRVLPPSEPARLKDALKRLAAGEFDWAVFTSANGVRWSFRTLKSLGLDARALSKTKVAAVGPGTSRALQAEGISPDLLPPAFLTSALAEAFPAREPGAGTGGVLLLRAEGLGPELREALARKAWVVEEVAAYRIGFPDSLPPGVEQVLARHGVDLITFTSASTVRGFLGLFPEGLPGDPPAACIGPVAAEEARRAGLKVEVVAEEHSIAGLVLAITSWWEGRRGRLAPAAASPGSEGGGVRGPETGRAPVPGFGEGGLSSGSEGSEGRRS